MPFSFQHRFGFVHIQKTGGVSLVAALREAGVALDFMDRGLEALLDAHPHGALLRSSLLRTFPFAPVAAMPQEHMPAMILRALVGPDVWDASFTFAFVRNPWARAVSLYAYLRARSEQEEFSGRRPDMVAIMDRSPDFSSFLRETSTSADMTARVIGEDGRLLVSFVGRYETLASDIARVEERIGLRVNLPHLNASEHGDYRAYYSPSDRELVARQYARDIERFGYSF
ncbi:MAG: sulfotransferase family 2 domain-containing protein [bacterium]|nr:sulfotransferase family 2 domain-containing protein [bacterium]